MGADDHKRGKRKKDFCTQPAKPKCADCPCPKDYIEICKPRWAGVTFERLVNAEDGKFVFDKKYEAHHLVCVAPATKELLGKRGIQPAIEQTKWCINNKQNMLGMPLWGHTVKWYCSFSHRAGKVTGKVKAGAKPPPFKNIPQHDFDHNCKGGYTSEVETKCKKLAKDIKESGHKLKGESLAEALGDMSEFFEEELLESRGIRKGGTHAAWKLALNGDSEWCHPFSMASDGKVTSVSFPVKDFDSKLERWIQRIANAIAGR